MASVSAWQVWLVASLLLFVAEVLAPGFWLLSVAVGCVLAGAGSLLGPGYPAPLPSFAPRALLSPAGIPPLPLERPHPPRRRIQTHLGRAGGPVGRGVQP